MIKRIISGGQRGAERAALDAAMEYGIPHGGWIPKGRRTENGRLSDQYRLKETSTIDYLQNTELNVLDSDGTLIFRYGELAGGPALAQKFAKKHRRPCLPIDLQEITEYKAVVIIRSWIEIREIEILNVAGSKASDDPFIYDIVRGIIKSVLYPPPEQILRSLPKTVEEVVERLVSELPLKEKAAIAKMKKGELSMGQPHLEKYIGVRFGLWSGNTDLIDACRRVLEKNDLQRTDAPAVILRELWKKLRETHVLRPVR